MIVTDAKNLIGTDRDVKCPNGGFNSLRILLESDGMGFGLTQTTIPKGDPQTWHYKHHLEACFCIEGEGELVNEETGEKHIIKPGVCYSLNNHDLHTMQALTNKVVLVCVFNPPLKGNEVHREDGSYSTDGSN